MELTLSGRVDRRGMEHSMRRRTTTAKFWIDSPHVAASRVTDVLGKEPTAVQVMGELNSGGRRYPKHYWEYEFEAVDWDHTDELKAEIMRFCRDSGPRLEGLPVDGEYQRYLSLVFRRGESFEGMDFAPEELRELAEAGWGLDISIYGSREEDG